MCTIIFLPGPNGQFILAGNRDEMRSRKKALLPQVHKAQNTTCLYPIDANAGGTWIGVNAHGLAATLLNAYQASNDFEPKSPIKTRGDLVKIVLKATTLKEAQQRLHQHIDALPHIRPFTLAAAQCNAVGAFEAWAFCWDGHTLSPLEWTTPYLIISSSVRLEEAQRARTKALANLKWHASSEHIIAAFAQDNNGQPDFSTVCMARDDARTVSHTCIQVGVNEIKMTYLNHPPNQNESAHISTFDKI